MGVAKSVVGVEKGWTTQPVRHRVESRQGTLTEECEKALWRQALGLCEANYPAGDRFIGKRPGVNRPRQGSRMWIPVYADSPVDDFERISDQKILINDSFRSQINLGSRR